MSLLSLQRDFRRWLTDESVDAATRIGDSAAPGLSVYLNNYRGQLIHCLNNTFPKLRAWIGEDAFETTAALHVDRVPPSSWTLDAYARDFPGTVASQYSDDPEVAELALLDLALADAFVGRDAIPVAAETLGEVDWDTAAIRFIPTLKILPLRTNAPSIWRSLNIGTSPPSEVEFGDAVSVMIWRQDFTTSFRVLDPDETLAITDLAKGTTFAELCARLVDRVGDADGTACAGAWLGRWLSDGLIAAIEGG